ncbi:response regulator [Prolixibacteraceae bacterium JC049]|nr:response regulator [Prolixibacteraceae bacterium JC049]
MQNRRNPLIFVVEDNQVYNKLVVSYLKSNKYTNVKEFHSGEDCINNLEKKPDIIIQDYLLEGMTGIDVLKKAKQITPDTEFIFLSGQDSIDVAINSMKYGAYDYIVKDQMALKKLVNKINKIMSVNKLRRSNKQYKTGVTMFFVALIVLILAIFVVFFTDLFQ